MTKDEIIEIGARAMHDGTAADRGSWEARKFSERRAYLDAMRRALDAFNEAGLGLAPEEATEAMTEAGLGQQQVSASVNAIYRAMIRAAQES